MRPKTKKEKTRWSLKEEPVTAHNKDGLTEPYPKKGCVVNTSIVNVRKEPTKHGGLLEYLYSGENVTITGWNNGFYEVETLHHKKGYIMENYVKIMEEG